MGRRGGLARWRRRRRRVRVAGGLRIGGRWRVPVLGRRHREWHDLGQRLVAVDGQGAVTERTTGGQWVQGSRPAGARTVTAEAMAHDDRADAAGEPVLQRHDQARTTSLRWRSAPCPDEPDLGARSAGGRRSLRPELRACVCPLAGTPPNARSPSCLRLAHRIWPDPGSTAEHRPRRRSETDDQQRWRRPLGAAEGRGLARPVPPGQQVQGRLAQDRRAAAQHH